MLERMLNRAKTSGRVDDTEVIFEERYRGFLVESEEIIHYFEQEGKLVRVMMKSSMQDQESRF